MRSLHRNWRFHIEWIGAVIFCFCSLTCYAQKPEIPAPVNITPAQSVYKTEIFNLVLPDSPGSTTKEGRAVSKALNKFLRSSGLNVKDVWKRLFSGPADEGKLLKMGDDKKWFYTICQAHQCPLTNIDVFYDEKTQQMSGRLLNRCSTYWLGPVTDAEMAFIRNTDPVDFDANAVKLFCQGDNK